MDQTSVGIFAVIVKFLLIGLGVASGVGIVVIVFLVVYHLVHGASGKFASFRQRVRDKAEELKNKPAEQPAKPVEA